MPPTSLRPAAAPAEWLLLVALLAVWPLSTVLPAAWAREGDMLENAQVLLLGAGGVHALARYLRTRPARAALLALWAAPVWLLLAGRELSWGRVLVAPAAPHGAGALWLQPAMRPLAMLVVAGLVLSACYYRIDALVRSALLRRTPWLCLAVALGAALGSTCAEGHLSCSPTLLGPYAQRVEELAELLAYAALFLL